jgi:hypothetical protein
MNYRRCTCSMTYYMYQSPFMIERHMQNVSNIPFLIVQRQNPCDVNFIFLGSDFSCS